MTCKIVRVSLPSEGNHTFRLSFNNEEVKNHPDYRAIRRQVLVALGYV
jgi:hypothetical protein